ncbi:MAG: flagellar biosynthetic protein FliO [Desulfosoma sp.]
MDLTVQALKTFGALAVVILVLFGAAFALKRWGHRFADRSDKALINVLERRYLGPKHCLLLVRVAEDTLLLGMSPQGLSFLAPVHAASAPLADRSPLEDERP